MARTNVAASAATVTHEGAPARQPTKKDELTRIAMTAMLWEDSFYETGSKTAERLIDAVHGCAGEDVVAVAIRSREEFKLRHVPLLMARELCRHRDRSLAGALIERVIQRADELAEFVALYWRDGRKPLSAQAKKGLARAFKKFDAHQLAKYNRDNAVKLRDVAFLCHVKGGGPLIANLANREFYPEKTKSSGFPVKEIYELGEYEKLKTPDTWEVELSASKDKKASWTRLLAEKKLGAMALLRNLRNMTAAGIEPRLIGEALAAAKYDRVLPFRFIPAAKVVPSLEPDIDAAFLRGLSQIPKLPGTTYLVVDVSASMYGGKVSQRSDMDKAHAACALAAIVREVSEHSRIYATAGNDLSRQHATQEIPPRRGLPLVDAVYAMCRPLGGGGIFLKQVTDFIRPTTSVDRLIVITDEQDCSGGGEDSPSKAAPFGRYNYIINVASYDRTINFGAWTTINGFSEAVLQFIQATEAEG